MLEGLLKNVTFKTARNVKTIPRFAPNNRHQISYS